MTIKPVVLIIGLGGISRLAHVPYLKSLNIQVKYAVDPDPLAQKFIKEQFTKIHILDSLSHIPDEVNCALICTPTAFHYDQVQQLLDYGINVLCEKPLGYTQKEAEELADKAKQKKLILQAGYYRRFHPAAQAVKKILIGTELGQLQKCEMFAGHPVRAGELSPAYFNKSLSKGGVLCDFGVHLIDRLISWFDSIDIKSYYDDSCGGVEANCLMNADAVLNNKIVPIKLILSRTNKLGYYSMLYFESGNIRIEHNSGHSFTYLQPLIKILNKNIIPSNEIILSTPVSSLYYFTAQWNEFTDRINGSEEKLSSLQGAIKTNAVIEKCYSIKKQLGLPWETQLFGD